MVNEYTFKKATVKDLKKFFVFFSKSIQEQFTEYTVRTRKFFLEQEYTPKAIEIQMKSKMLILYLAFHKQEVVSYLIVRPISGGVSLCVWLAVSVHHQKQGIASKLLIMSEKDAKKTGMHNINLWTNKRNLTFYKNRGFRVAGKVPKNYYGHDDYLLYKIIQKPVEKNYLRA